MLPFCHKEYFFDTLEPIMCERFVRLSHTMNVFTLFNCIAFTLSCIHKFPR